MKEKNKHTVIYIPRVGQKGSVYLEMQNQQYHPDTISVHRQNGAYNISGKRFIRCLFAV